MFPPKAPPAFVEVWTAAVFMALQTLAGCSAKSSANVQLLSRSFSPAIASASVFPTIARMQEITALDGALLVDKPAGWTSHDVVAKIRNHFRIPKVGHCGTLDPNATGLLIIVLGRGTKLSEKLMSSDKVYEGEAKLGETTNSYDADGEVVSTAPVPPLTVDRLNEEACKFVGDLMQLPPMVSAVKIEGVPLYKLARKGMEVERKERLVHIYTFHFTAYAEPIGSFRVACTKGTYVRALVHDLGQRLGCGAHLKTLRRIDSGKFSVNDSTPLEKILQWSPVELASHVIPFFELARAE
jgi:tRNA pseudouridine55 synthase